MEKNKHKKKRLNKRDSDEQLEAFTSSNVDPTSTGNGQDEKDKKNRPKKKKKKKGEPPSHLELAESLPPKGMNTTSTSSTIQNKQEKNKNKMKGTRKKEKKTESTCPRSELLETNNTASGHKDGYIHPIRPSELAEIVNNNQVPSPVDFQKQNSDEGSGGYDDSVAPGAAWVDSEGRENHQPLSIAVDGATSRVEEGNSTIDYHQTTIQQLTSPHELVVHAREVQVSDDDVVVADALICGLSKRWAIIFIAIIVLVVALVIAVAIAAGLNDNKDEDGVGPISSTPEVPTSPPTISPTQNQLEAYVRLALDKSTTIETVLSNPSSAEYQALDWLVRSQEEPLSSFTLTDVDTVVDKQVIIERYILAVFYFSTNGPKWPNHVSVGWLSPLPVCQWAWIVCDDDTNMRVQDFEFGENEVLTDGSMLHFKVRSIHHLYLLAPFSQIL